MMEVILTVLDKALVVLFILAALNLIRHMVRIGQNFFAEAPTRYVLNERELIIVGLSASYIIMSLIKGIGL